MSYKLPVQRFQCPADSLYSRAHPSLERGLPRSNLMSQLLSSAMSGSSLVSLASAGGLDLTRHWAGYVALACFVIAYALVMAEEFTKLKKSGPVILAAGFIWAMLAFVNRGTEHAELVEQSVRHAVLEYSEILLFLLTAMAYINAMTDRGIFDALRVNLIRRRYSYRKLFWITGVAAFFMSAIFDNLTTALVLGAVVCSVGRGNQRFIQIGCINIVVAANAGGAFSPFGDITTLMVWQKGVLAFGEFFNLFVPSVVNYVLPAVAMGLAVPKGVPEADADEVMLKPGAWQVLGLFLLTIATAVTFHSVLGIPPFLGMVTGLGMLQVFGYYLEVSGKRSRNSRGDKNSQLGDVVAFDTFRFIERAEWDTLLFFYGVILCVAGLGFVGYLSMVSHTLYEGWSPTMANVTLGVMSAVIDNIPIMAAVLQMNPAMSDGQWLMITLTAGVGGSLLSVGSAAGVALMGQSKHNYTFFKHLMWTPVIALGYFASIWVHMLINAKMF